MTTSSVPLRPTGPGRKMSSMRPPTQRPGPSRAQTATPTLMAGRASPAGSTASSKTRTPKRKAVSEIPDHDGGEETNINVVVRCRGRNDREVRENSGVVVSTEGIKGKKVELSMGPSALSNKTYSFDKVFSPAADQGIIFDEVVVPILDEVLSGFNCTIFAYGQTGTGKTYTMSGDISNVLPIPEAAGVIPRVLHYLFDRLGGDDNEQGENSVKCSFIELYNEELRDLLAADESAKLKIYDEANKQGRTTTMVQGMEESYIRTASKGIRLLCEGSHRRQVAATRCNDLSSRSHTVFTITITMKRTTETGDDYMCTGKLNLVDLAGSENIQRSGAENKRATEAGLINKSLLTLGRVINALVEKSSHIPYRESKLTRLLQDSLGGRTKTCIIATLSPAKSNLEETISTLDYAFRAKNIRNKPQVNQMVSKKTLLREFTAEIEKLKSELIATRQRNGVYLTSESYEEITTESESRRILSEEQRDIITTLETTIRNKGQELFNLNTTFRSLKRDNEQTRVLLDGAKGVLEKTEIILAHTKRTLVEESLLKEAHQATEVKLAATGEDLLGALDTTTNHVDRLHSKLRRRSDLQSLNRAKWSNSRDQVVGVTVAVEDRIEAFRVQQEDLIASLSQRMQGFVSDEMQELHSSQALLREKTTSFHQSQVEVDKQSNQAKENMDKVLEEITTLRADVKEKVGDGLNDLSAAAQRIGAGIANDLHDFHDQLQQSFVALGREFKTTFEDLIKRMSEQQVEAQRLRQHIAEANAAFVEAGQVSHAQLSRAVEDERQTAATERAALLAKVTELITSSATAHETRLTGYLESANKRVKLSENEYEIAQQSYGSGMDAWGSHSQALIDSATASRESVKSKLKADWSAANEHTTRLVDTTNAVHTETVRIVDDQMTQMDSQLVALDEIVSRVREQNGEHQKAHQLSLQHLGRNVEESYASIGKHFETSYNRVKELDGSMQERTRILADTLPGLADNSDIRNSLQDLRADVATAGIVEYSVTGDTPARTQYTYPTVLPRTEAHETLLDRMRGGTTGTSRARSMSPSKASPSKRSPTKLTRGSPTKTTTLPSSPLKNTIFTDYTTNASLTVPPQSVPPRPATATPIISQTVAANPASLRELDVNISNNTTATSTAATTPPLIIESTLVDPIDRTSGGGKFLPGPLKRHLSAPTSVAEGTLEPATKLPLKRSTRLTVAGLAEGRENLPVGLGAGLGASVGPGGRRLRNRGSD